MKCPKCNSSVEGEWEYCPKCGNRLDKGGFDNIFSRVEKEFEGMDRMLDKNFEVFDISPFFRQTPKGRGFTIKISTGSGREPKIDVKTFGDVDRKEIRNEMERMGISKGTGEIRGSAEPVKKQREESLRISGDTEEPRTEVKRIGDSIILEMEMPEIDSMENIEINSMENSIEVKAVSGKKAYFKILTKPAGSKITGKSFSDGVLRIELG